MVLVVLDANAVGVDPPLGKLEHRILLDSHRNGRIELVVPRLTLREAVNGWRDELRSRLDKLSNAYEAVRKVAPAYGGHIPQPDCDALAREMLRSLTAMLEAANVQIPDVPTVDQDALIERALGRHQPFDAAGSGYRDTLLWHVVIEAACDGQDVALISRDKAAFAHGRQDLTRLAQPLVDELAVLGVSGVLYADIHAAVNGLDLVAPGAVEAVDAVIDRFGPRFADHLVERMTEQLVRIVSVADTRQLVNPFIAKQAMLGPASTPRVLELKDARRLDNGQLEATVDLTVDQFVCIQVPAQWLGQVPGLVGASFEDSDLASAELEALVTHRCRVVLDPMGDVLVEAAPVEVIAIRRIGA